jgi:hypothetical protein
VAFGETVKGSGMGGSGRKVGPAVTSGMRGMGRQGMVGAGTQSEDGFDQANETPQEGHADVAGIIGQHIHVDPATGHHHLNLTSLATHIHTGKPPGA